MQQVQMFLSTLGPYAPIILPFLTTILAGILRQDGWPLRVNQAITAAFVLLAAGLSAFLAHALTPNAGVDFVVLIAYIATVQSAPWMQSLQTYLQSNWLAFLAPAGLAPAPVGVRNPPVPIVLPTSASVAPTPPTATVDPQIALRQDALAALDSPPSPGNL